MKNLIFKIKNNQPKTNELNFFRDNLSKNFIILLSKFLNNNANIKTLNLSNTNLDDEKISILCDSLENNKSIKKLILDNNKISSVGVKKIARVLIFNKTIEFVSLRKNKICDKGVGYLTTALNVNNTLRHLDIWDVNPTKENFISLNRTFNYNKSLTNLIIYSNGNEDKYEALRNKVLKNKKRIEHYKFISLVTVIINGKLTTLNNSSKLKKDLPDLSCAYNLPDDIFGEILLFSRPTHKTEDKTLNANQKLKINKQSKFNA